MRVTDPTLSRRALFGLGLAALMPRTPVGQQQEPSAQLPRPDMAGLPRARVTDYENDPFIVGLESKIRCTCGCNLSVYTCRTTDFTCQTSPAMHAQVIALVEQDKTSEEILADFVAQYGETVLMAPPRRGFNLAAYVVPGIVIAAIGGAMAWVLLRRMRRPATAPVTAAADAVASAGLSSEDAARLEAELERLER